MEDDQVTTPHAAQLWLLVVGTNTISAWNCEDHVYNFWSVTFTVAEYVTLVETTCTFSYSKSPKHHIRGKQTLKSG